LGEKNWGGGSLLEEKIFAEKFCQGKKFEVKKNFFWGGGILGGEGTGGEGRGTEVNEAWQGYHSDARPPGRYL
jgi:hypothetical protein